MAHVQTNLAQQTLRYWQILQTWNGIEHAKARSVQSALDELNDILSRTPEQRKLFGRAYDLKMIIVKHGTKEHQKKEIARSRKIDLVIIDDVSNMER